MKSFLLILALFFSGVTVEAQNFATTPNDRPRFGGHYPQPRHYDHVPYDRYYHRLPVCEREYEYLDWGYINYKWNCYRNRWFAGVVNGVDVHAATDNCQILTGSYYVRVIPRQICY